MNCGDCNNWGVPIILPGWWPDHFRKEYGRRSSCVVLYSFLQTTGHPMGPPEWNIVTPDGFYCSRWERKS